MLSVRAATVAAFAGLALIPSLAKAQDTPPPATPATPPVNLPPITVSAGRGSALDKLDVSTTLMKREQIQALPETGVDQIVNRIPGVWLPNIPTGQLHPTAQPVNIRGFGTSTTINTLVMVDGVPINDPYFRTINWSAIPKNSVERIEVIRGGGATSLWGNMAMGGVINIVTREPSKTGASADVSYGSYNTANAEVAGSAIVNDNVKIGMSYNHGQSSGYNLTPAQYQNVNLVPTASKADNVAASVFLTPSDKLKLFAKAYLNQTYEDGLVWTFAHNNWSTYRLLLGGSYQIDDKSSINVSGWVAGGSFGTINVASGSYTLNNTTATNQFVSQIEASPNADQGGSIFYEANFGPLRDVKIGVDARRTLITDYNSLYASATAKPTTFVTNGEHRFQGVFGQGTYRFTGVPVDVTVGVRGDFWQALNASVLTQNSSTLNVVPNASASSFDPRVGFKFYASDEVTLRGAIYRNFSAPGMNQMYRSFASGTAFTATNPNLQPMTNFGQEARLRLRVEGLHPVGHLLQQQPEQLHRLRDGVQHQPGLRGALHHGGGPQPRLHDDPPVPERRQRHLPGLRADRDLAALRAAQADRKLHQHRGLSHQLDQSGAGAHRRAARPGAELHVHGRRRMAPDRDPGLHGLHEVLPAILERHRSHAIERRRDPDRPRRAAGRRRRTSTSMAVSRT